MRNRSIASKRAAVRVAVVSTVPGPGTGAANSVAGSAASVTLLAANAGRKGAVIHNDSTAVLYVLLADATASASNYTHRLLPHGNFELPVTRGGVYTGRIAGIWASATGSARITEFT